MNMVELLVNTENLRETRIHEAPLPEPGPGEILVAIDKFAITSNNISYAVTGRSIGYWNFFPVPAPWGKVPVWGFADVIASNAPDVPVGERLWGFFPMASHLIMLPRLNSAGMVRDMAPHRQDLPALYNGYMRTTNDPPAMKPMEDARCVFLPLFATSFIVADYYLDNAYFGVDTIIIGSASSKTGFGLAGMLKQQTGSPRVIGLTSPRNTDFVRALGFFDQVVTYDDIETLPLTQAVAYVDMAGNGAITARVHQHFADAVKVSTLVGATHWEAPRNAADLPGARPQFFFAPAQFAKRTQDWGEGEPILRASMASLQLATQVKDHIQVTHARGPLAVQAAYLAMLEGNTPPDQGIMVSLHTGTEGKSHGHDPL
jgi:NADPH:quinone reductase-like Zn-dependent oxidoreductase